MLKSVWNVMVCYGFVINIACFMLFSLKFWFLIDALENTTKFPLNQKLERLGFYWLIQQPKIQGKCLAIMLLIMLAGNNTTSRTNKRRVPKTVKEK